MTNICNIIFVPWKLQLISVGKHLQYWPESHHCLLIHIQTRYRITFKLNFHRKGNSYCTVISHLSIRESQPVKSICKINVHLNLIIFTSHRYQSASHRYTVNYLMVLLIKSPLHRLLSAPIFASLLIWTNLVFSLSKMNALLAHLLHHQTISSTYSPFYIMESLLLQPSAQHPKSMPTVDTTENELTNKKQTQKKKKLKKNSDNNGNT